MLTEFKQPEYVAGVSAVGSAAPDPDYLVRLADAEPNPSALLRAMTEALAEIGGTVAAAEAAATETADKLTEAEEELTKTAQSLEDEQDIGDTFRELLREAAMLLGGCPDDETCEDFIERAEAELSGHPSRAEVAKREREDAERNKAAIERAAQTLEGFPALWEGHPVAVPPRVTLEYMVQRGRKWHRTSTVWCLVAGNVSAVLAAAEHLRGAHPGAKVRLVRWS